MSFSPQKIVPVTKADSDLPGGICAGLLVGVAGTLNVMDASGTTVTGVPVQAGYNPISVRQVRAGGTATNIFALY